MVQILAIEKVTLYDLEQTFNLHLVEDSTFFYEWQEDLPSLTIAERERLQRVQASYANLERRSLLENTVKMAIVAPLLDLAGFFLPPFYVDTETSVEIVAEEVGVQLRGRVDVLVLIEQLWVLIIEAKRAEFSLKVGIPQVLSYMLAAPRKDKPLFGLVTNGSSFVFLKLVLGDRPHYAKSKEFILDQDDGLSLTLQIMKRLGAIVAGPAKGI
jgi:Type I restriction enzyme R protein N terminus (HSDR_N)